jgi:hypothetical protein
MCRSALPAVPRSRAEPGVPLRGRPAWIGEGRPRRCGWVRQELFLKVTENFDPLSERALLVVSVPLPRLMMY